jgi:hexokinase
MADIHEVRYALGRLTFDMAQYSDADLRDIKNSAEVFAIRIRKELAARDARMVDEALAHLPAWVRNCPYANCRRCETEQECPAYREEKAK